MNADDYLKELQSQWDVAHRLIAALTSEDVLLDTDAIPLTRDHVVVARREGEQIRLRSVRLNEVEAMCQERWTPNLAEVLG